MKIFIIILFFILLNFILLNIKLDIKKIEIYNRKIKMNIYVKIYWLNKVKLFEKKIRKQDILKLIKLSELNKIQKRERNLIKKLYIQMETCNIQILYNLKNPVYSAYIYGTLQAILNILITSINSKSRNIIIKTGYRGKVYICVSIKININIAKSLIKTIKNKTIISSKV